MTPFECIHHGSWQTAIKLLQLEKDFDLRDAPGNTFLHVLMDRAGNSIWGIKRNEYFLVSDQEQMIEQFWKYILENGHQFAINLNSQNKYGCTPLHVAADNMAPMKSLEVMLSRFEHVDPFICDENKENFFHRYCVRDKTIYAAEFQDRMLNGRLRNLSQTTVAKLLSSQNMDKNTPLHILIKECDEYATEEFSRFFNDDNYLDPDSVRGELDDILEELYKTEDLFQHPNISFVAGRNYAVHRPTFNFSFYWKSCLHKHLLVDIDLVPACQVKNWWPENCNLEDLEGDSKALKEQGAILLLQSELHDIVHDCKLRVSAMSVEKEHMLNLPKVGRDAYKVCKILCDRRMCPDLHVKADIAVKKVITSYMLKNTVFYVMNDIKVSEETKSFELIKKKSRLDKSFELQTIVRNTFLKLLKFAKEENLPSFVFPWQNIFTFNSKVKPEHNHYFCAFRYSFLKVILSLLGEVQTFSDIDEESCSQAVEDRVGSESDDSIEDEEEHIDMESLISGLGDSDFCFYTLL